MEESIRKRVSGFFRSLQAEICGGLEKTDGKALFSTDDWERPGGGGGTTRILQDGSIFEKAGVNVSVVAGRLPETVARALDVRPGGFFATGISLVIHPLSPMIPTVHANYRYFETEHGGVWFGGGSDMTPYYLFPEDVRHFHGVLRKVCDRHDLSYYGKFKKGCDEYFHVKHRGEGRGTGGIFFDFLRGNTEEIFGFVQSAGSAFLESYLPIVGRRRTEPWDDRHRQWQLIRRGRYVEFNLIYDRGTMFGLETNGRVESILMSLPPMVQWRYQFTPEPGSREEELVEVLKNPRDWT
jgi:coproporphyrinogen III oxidase